MIRVCIRSHLREDEAPFSIGTLVKVLLLANGTQEQTTGKLMLALAAGLGRHGQTVSPVLRSFPRGIMSKLQALTRSEPRNLLRILDSDVVVVHSTLSLSLMSMVAARLLRRPVIAFVWDLYPQSARIAGNITHPWLLWLYNWTESLGYRLASTITVPSSDYVRALDKHSDKVVVSPLWPTQDLSHRRRPAAPDASVLRLGFAGQINGIRGIESAIDTVAAEWRGITVEVHVFARDPVPGNLADRAASDCRLRVVEHGFLPVEVLSGELAALDLGWVCLDEGFELPAFPSKTWAYLGAGLPILYTGPEMPGLEEWLESNGFGMSLRQGDGLGPTDVSTLRAHLIERRDEYVARMESLWFDIDRLL